MRIEVIASKTGLSLIGDTDRSIRGIKYAAEATTGDIGIIEKSSDISLAGSDVIAGQDLYYSPGKTILTSNEKSEKIAIIIAKAMIELGVYPDYSKAVAYSMTPYGYYIGQNTNIDKTAIIQPGAYIGDNVTIGKNVIIEPMAIISSGCIISDDTVIHSGAIIGSYALMSYCNEKPCVFQGVGKTIIGTRCSIGSQTIIQRGSFSDTVIGNNVIIGDHCDIGHDVKINDNCIICSQCGFAGKAVIGKNVIIYGQCAVNNNVIIGDNSKIMARTRVIKSVEPNKKISGEFGRDHYYELKLQVNTRRKIYGDNGRSNDSCRNCKG